MPAFRAFVPELIERLQDVGDRYLEEFDEHKAFVYLIAELFENTKAGSFITGSDKLIAFKRHIGRSRA